MPADEDTAARSAGWERRRAKNLEKAMQMPRIPCECGCGEMILALKGDGKPRRFFGDHGNLIQAKALPLLALPRFPERPACAQDGIDPDLFWAETASPEDRAKQKQARAICRRCPVIVQCRRWADDHAEPGIWAGMTRQQRASAKARRAAA